MRYRQNKKFIDPRYFMDEKTDVAEKDPKKDPKKVIDPKVKAPEADHSDTPTKQSHK
tara:strand:- start:369 stop:539 length:171 start_codon:yes stop_codon:yes gene_type:complete